MKKLHIIFLLLFAFWFSIGESQAQLTIQDGNTVGLPFILQQLTGQGVIITNVKVLSGGVVSNSATAKAAYGFYESADPLDLDGIGTKGLVISSGRVLDFGASNGILHSSGVFASSGMGIGGEPFISGSTFDGCSIEFDIRPIGDEIYFNYCFASEEYPEYVGSPFNDVFKFMVTGPNPTGGAPYSKTNIAIVPGTGIPGTANPGIEVAINSVNSGNGPVPASFPQYHNPNGSADMVYDQRTKNLVARVNVVPCALYTFRLAIADRSDAIFDSGVFIQALNSNVPSMELITPNSVVGAGFEGCVDAIVKMTRTKTTGPETFRVKFAGTATYTTDYDVEFNNVPISTSLPNTYDFTFPVGVASVEFKLKPKIDGLVEPTEIADVELYKPSCNAGADVFLAKKSVNILDKDSYQIIEDNRPNTIYRCTATDPVPKLRGVLADAYQWETVGGSFTYTDATQREITPATQTTDATYKLKATIGSCVLERTITINYAVLDVNTPAPICTGQVATLIATGRTNYTWTPATGLSCTNCATPEATPTVTTTYTVTGTEGTAPDGCSSSKTVTVTVINQPGPQFVGLDAQYCVNATPVTLAANPTGGTFQINGIAATQFNPSILGAGQHEVKYIKNAGGGTCADFVIKTVLVNALPTITFTGANSVCKNGTPIPVSATPAGGIFKIGTTTITQIDPALYPIGDVTLSYAVTDANTGCINTTTSTVAITPLPTYEWQNVLDSYCRTNTTLITPRLKITDPNGTITNVDLNAFKPSLQTNNSLSYSYTVTAANGCSVVASKTITITDPPAVSFVNLLDTYCKQGAPVTLTATPAGGTFTVNGTPATQLDPSLFNANDVVTIVYTYTGAGCVVDINKSVTIKVAPAIVFTVNSTVCKNGLPIAISATPAGGVFKIGTATITQIDPALYSVGNVSVTYEVTDGATGCLNTATTAVSILPIPTFEWLDVDDSYCATNNITITPKLKITDSDGTVTTETFPAFNPSVVGAGNNVPLTREFTGASGCKNTTSKTVTINTPPTVVFVGLLDEYCQQALPITLKANPAGGTFKVNGVATSQLEPMTFQVGDVVNVSYAYTSGGCLVEIDKDVDIVQGTAYVPVDKDMEVCPPSAQGYPLEALTLAETQAGYSFKWTSTAPRLNGANTRVIYVREDEGGTHSVLIRDAGNCPIAEKVFDIKIKCNTSFYVPTAFTPNADGKNELLQIFGADFTKLRFTIYNRWGEVVFTARSKSEGWDGLIKGSPAPAGIYAWRATYESVLQPGKVVEKQGSINLIR